LTAVDIILSVLAFVILLAGRKHLMSTTCYVEGESGVDPETRENGGPASSSPAPGRT